MRLTILYYNARTSAKSEPYCFSHPIGEFVTLAEAVETAHRDAGPGGNGAVEFQIVDDVGNVLVHRLLRGSTWEPVDA